jgi:hypothetical protein
MEADTMLPFDPAVPNVARIYDVLLGGKDNFGPDREAAGRLMRLVPDAPLAARQNRLFLQRAVSFLAGQGITQFIDIGSGLPTVCNTHELALAEDRRCKVAYIDYDPVVVAHARAILAGGENVSAEAGDLRDPAPLVAGLRAGGLIDLDRPAAVMLVAVLHFVAEPECYEAVGYLKEQMAPGSYLVISHATADEASGREHQAAAAVYAGASAPVFARTRSQVARFFHGLELAGPGITGVGQWGAGIPRASRTLCYAGIGRKP